MSDLECMAIFRLQDLISAPLRAIQSAMSAAKTGAAGLATRMVKLTAVLAPLAIVLGLVTGAFAGAAMATVPTQKALGELASVGVTDMRAMTNAAADFSNQWAGTTKTEFIAAAYDIKSGISSLSDAGVAGMTELSALTAKATKATVGEMTSLFATGHAIYKQQFAELSDIQFGELFSAGLSASVQQFKTTGSQMQAAISNLGAEATNAGVAMREQFAILGQLQATMSGSEAGTKYKAFLQSIAKGGKDLGLSVLDAQNKLRSMPEILEQFRAKYGATLDAVEKQQISKALGRDEAVAVIDLLYNKTDQLSDSVGFLGDAMDKGRGFTSEMAGTMNRDLGASLQLLGQRAHNLIEIFGGMFAPAVGTITDAVGWLIVELQDAAKWLDATGIGAGIMSTVAIMAVLTAGVVALGAAWPLLSVALGPVVATLGAVLWPMTLITAAVVALKLAWDKNFLGMRDVIQGAFAKVSLIVQGVFALLKSVTSEGMGFISAELGRDLQANGLLGVVTTIAKVGYRIMEFFAGLWDSISAGLSGLGAAFAPVWDSLSGSLAAIGAALGSVLALFGGVGGEASGWRIFGEIVGSVVAFAFRALALAVRMALVPVELIAGAVSWLVSLFTGAETQVSSFGSMIGNVFSGVWATLSALFPEFAALLTTLVTAFTSFDLTGVLTGLVDSIRNFFAGISLADAGAALINTLISGVKSAIGGLYSVVSGAFSSVAKLFNHSDADEGPFSRTSAAGRALMATYALGASQGAPQLAATVGAAFGDAAKLAAQPIMGEMGMTPAAYTDLSKAFGLDAAAMLPAMPSLSGMSDSLSLDPPAPSLQDPALPLNGSSDGLRETDKRAGLDDETGAGSGSPITIHHLVVNAPNVKDGDSFVQSLQRLVEQYDV